MSATCIRCGLSFEPTTDLRVCASCAAMIAPTARKSDPPRAPSEPPAFAPPPFAPPPPPGSIVDARRDDRSTGMSGASLLLALACSSLLLDFVQIAIARARDVPAVHGSVATCMVIADVVFFAALLTGRRWARRLTMFAAGLGLLAGALMLPLFVSVTPAAVPITLLEMGLDGAWLWALMRPDVVERFR